MKNTVSLFRNTRKTEWGAKLFLSRWAARAAPFALMAAVALLSLWRIPAPLQAQSTNDRIILLGRDIGELSRKIDTIRTGQSDRMDQIEALLKQAAEATHAVSAELKAMQQNLEKSMQKSLTEQQTRVSDPIAAVRSGVDNVGQDVLAVRGEMSAMNTRIGKMEAMLDTIQAAIRVLSVPAPAPPPTAPAVSASDSADLLFAAAERDFLSGKNELAQMEFSEFWSKYPSSPNAPRALLFLGQIYDRVGMFKDARDAFDTILERFPDSTTTPEAAFWKAEMLSKEGNRAAAITEFDNFVKKYPSHLSTATAKAKADALRRSKGK